MKKLIYVLTVILLSAIGANAQFSADNDGNLNVSPVNGIMNYTYPISNNSIDGYPIDVRMTYLSNLRYAHFKGLCQDRHYRDSIVYINTDPYPYPDHIHYPIGTDYYYEIMDRFTYAISTWVMSVNGFVINALKQNSFYLDSVSDSRSRLDNMLIEGYDICNRMQTSRYKEINDKIKILKADGSILELVNKNKFGNWEYSNSNYNDAKYYTGYYYDNSINSTGYGRVEYDTKYYPPFIQEELDSNHYNPNSFKPRVLRYYMGDGLEYVFREVIAPYGLKDFNTNEIGLYQQLDVYGTRPYLHTGKYFSPGVLPTIFYLEEINNGEKTLVKFDRKGHNYTDNNTKIQRGRAFIDNFTNHKISIDKTGMLIQNFDKTYRFILDVDGNTYLPRSVWNHPLLMQDNEFNSKTDEILTDFRIDNHSNNFLVYKIIDPQNRITEFNYYGDFIYTDTDIRYIPLSQNRHIERIDYPMCLKEVIEPTKRIVFDYYKDWVCMGRDFRYDTVSTKGLSYNLLNCVKTIKHYELDNNNTLLKSLNYYFSDDTVNNIRYSKVSIVDNIINKKDSIEYEFKLFTVNNNSQYMPQKSVNISKYKKYRESTNDSIDVTDKIISETEYRNSSELGSTSNNGLIPYFTLILKEENGVPKYGYPTVLNSYEFETISTFGGDTALSNKYGQGIKKVTSRMFYDSDSNNVILTTEKYFKNLQRIVYDDTRYTDIYSAQLSYLRNDSLMGLYGNTSPIAVTTRYLRKNILPPIYGIPIKEIVRDATGKLLGGKTMNYNLADGTIDNYRRGAIISDSVILKDSSIVFNAKYNYNARKLLVSVENEFGQKGMQYFKYSDIPGYENTFPSGKILNDNNSIYNTYLYNTMFEFEAPVANESYTHRYDAASNSFKIDTIRNYFERTKFGNINAIIDQNGWYSKTAYDNIGRITAMWLPFDFPVCIPINFKTNTANIPLYDKKTTITRFYDSIDVIHKTIKRIPICLPEYDGLNLLVGNSEYTYPDKLGDSINTFNKHKEKYSTSLNYIASANDLFHNGATVQSAKLRLAYFGSYSSNSFMLKITTNQFGFEKHIVIGNNSLDSTSSQDPIYSNNNQQMLLVDLNSIITKFQGTAPGNTLNFKIESLSDCGKIEFLNQSEDSRPVILCSYLGCDSLADFTTMIQYDDTNHTITSYSKIDDNLHTSNSNWELSSAEHFGRYSGSKSFYGADNRNLKNWSYIGNPFDNKQTRIDEVSFSLTGFGNIISVKDQNDKNFENIRNGNGQIVAVKAPDDTRKEINSETIYVQNDNFIPSLPEIDCHSYYYMLTIKSFKNETGKVTKQYYDGMGRLRIEINNATDINPNLKLKTRYEYDEYSNISYVINPANDTTFYYYDNYNRIIRKSDKNVGTVSYAYDKLGNLRFVQDEEQFRNDNFTFLQIDDLGRNTIVGEATITGLESRICDVINPNYLHYDNNNSELFTNPTIFRNSTAFQNIVNISGLDTTSIFPAVNGTLENLYPGTYLRHNYIYPTFYSVISSDTNSFEDIANFPRNVRVASYYDEMPPKVGAIWGNMPDTTKWNAITPFYTWDRGNRTPKNLIGRRSAVAYRDDEVDALHYVLFSYDPRGRVQGLMRYTENLGFDGVYYTYNSANQVICVRQIDPIKQFVTWYSYDQNGRVDSVWTKVTAKGTGFGITTLSLPDAPFKPTTADLAYTYNKRGGVDTIRFVPANVYQAFTYNPRGWLDTMITKNQFNTLIFRQTFERDEAGSIERQISTHQNTALNCNEYYTYDNLNRLTNWNNGSAQQSFTYDKMGNRQTDVLNSQQSNYFYESNNPNRLNSYKMKTANQEILKKYTYNGNGSVTYIDIRDIIKNTSHNERFNYNYAGVPTSYIKSVNSETVKSFCSGTNLSRNPSLFIWDYRYSPLGGREQKKLSKSPLGDFCKEDANYHGWTYYALGAGGEQLTVYKGVQESWVSGTRKVTFYAHSYLTCGGILVTLPDSTKQFNVFDHLGSARVKISVKNNAIVSTQGFNYKPFGDTLRCSGTDRVGFIGKELDEENNYFLFGVRNYDKQTGRFLSVDPLWESFRNYTPYHYSYNNPISFKDPTGFAPEKEENELQGKKEGNKLMVMEWLVTSEIDGNYVNFYEEELSSPLGPGQGRTFIGRFKIFSTSSAAESIFSGNFDDGVVSCGGNTVSSSGANPGGGISGSHGSSSESGRTGKTVSNNGKNTFSFITPNIINLPFYRDIQVNIKCYYSQEDKLDYAIKQIKEAIDAIYKDIENGGINIFSKIFSIDIDFTLTERLLNQRWIVNSQILPTTKVELNGEMIEARERKIWALTSYNLVNQILFFSAELLNKDFDNFGGDAFGTPSYQSSVAICIMNSFWHEIWHFWQNITGFNGSNIEKERQAVNYSYSIFNLWKQYGNNIPLR